MKLLKGSVVEVSQIMFDYIKYSYDTSYYDIVEESDGKHVKMIVLKDLFTDLFDGAENHAIRFDIQQTVVRNNSIDWLSGSRNCYRCGKDVYNDLTIEEALKTRMTGCPYCHVSYCD